MKYAVIKFAEGQFKVCENDQIEVIGHFGEKGKEIKLDQVLFLCDNGKLKLGNPILKDASVTAEGVEQKLGEKIGISKFKAKTGYRRKSGFRPKKTQLLIKKIDA
jgi:large subunit ribosomal protein L21